MSTDKQDGTVGSEQALAGKEAWEAPDIRSLESPDINEGSFATHESVHPSESTSGSLS